MDSWDSPLKGFRTPKQYLVLTGSPSPRARTVNAKRWVRSVQAVSRFDGESKSRTRMVNAK